MSPPHNIESQVKPYYAADTDWSQPAIIPPTIFKQEINDDSRIDNHLSRAILQQWRAATALLSVADIIIIIGYSFPVSDFHAKRLFQISRMIRNRTEAAAPTIVYCCGREEEAGEKRSIMLNLYGEGTTVKTYVGFENTTNVLGDLLNRF
jgi:hypothetical protein